MDNWVAVNYNATSYGPVQGTAEIRDASADLIDALYTAALNKLPFPLPMKPGLVMIQNVNVTNVPAMVEPIDISAFGSVGRSFLTQTTSPARRDVEVSFVDYIP